MSSSNLILQEYAKRGGATLSENATKFIATIWRMFTSAETVSAYEATLESGFDEDGEEDMFLPLCERLERMGLVKAFTELTHDSTRTEIVAGSRKDGVRFADFDGPAGYGRDELKSYGLKDGEKVYSSVTLQLQAPLIANTEAGNSNDSEEVSDGLDNSEVATVEPEKKDAPTETPREKKADGPHQDAQNSDVAPDKEIKTRFDFKMSPQALQDDQFNSAGLPLSQDDQRRLSERFFASASVANEADALSVGQIWRGAGRTAIIAGKSDRPKAKVCLVLDDEDFEYVEQEVSDHLLKKYWCHVGRGDVTRLQTAVAARDLAGLVELQSELYARASTIQTQTQASVDAPNVILASSQESDPASASQVVAAQTYKSALKHANSDSLAKDKNRTEDDVIGEAVPQTATFLGRTLARAKKIGVMALGAIVATLVAYVAWQEKTKVDESTKKIAAQLDEPSLEYRLVKRTDMEALQAQNEDLTAKLAALVKDREVAVRLALEDARKASEVRMAEREEAAIKRGRADALGLSPSAKDKLNILGQTNAVINGECEAYGRGNRIDRIFPTNLPVRVLFWVVEPQSMRVTGVVAMNDDLLTRADGPVNQIRCILGKADVWPSYGPPQIGGDGQARPLASDGNAVEVNPRLR